MCAEFFTTQGSPIAECPPPRLLKQTHRTISVFFTLTVVANFIVRVWRAPPDWITYAPLPPLFILMVTGLCMFARPYLSGRGDRSSGLNA